MTDMGFEESVEAISCLHRFAPKPGLERMRAALEVLGNPHHQFKSIHVTGTKGKGSTTAMAAAILSAHGLKVGSYLSPFVFDIRERIQVQGEMISRQEFAHAAHVVLNAFKSIESELGPPTEFEVKTAMGFMRFAESEVDLGVIEVGIGGRLDSTNVIESVCSVITSIGLDHTQILGPTTRDIAIEKCGILRAGRPCITACTDPEAMRVIEGASGAMNCPLIKVHAQCGIADIQIEVACDTGCIKTEGKDYTNLKLGLGGTFQWDNAACAIGAAEVGAVACGIELDSERVREALRQVSLPGRMQIVRRRPLVILDGAHNAMAAKALVHEVKAAYYKNFILIVGMVAGHDPAEFLAAFLPLRPKLIATQPQGPRALPRAILADTAASLGMEVESNPDVEEAVRAATAQAGKEDLILVTGSFYTIGDLGPYLGSLSTGATGGALLD